MNISHTEEESITAINIAPLVDVVLVLLIIFMATAPLIHRRSVNVNVPKAAHAEVKATTALNLAFTEKRELYLGEDKISYHDLKFQLSSMLRADPGLHIALLADQTIPYGEVVEILDLIRGSGVKKIALEVRSKKVE